jgi:osmotically-inducible protein OsmY
MFFHRSSVAAVLLVGLAQLPIAAAPQAAGQAAETAIVAAVKRALSGQSDLRGLTVSASGGDVTLSGRLPTLWHKQDAVKRTLKVDGVQNVVTEIELPRAESDLGLAYRIGPAIERYSYYTIFDYVDAVIRNGVVTLTGSVTPDRNKAEENAAEVARVRGVQEIRNGIVTLPPSFGDDQIRAALYTRIFDSIHFQGQEIGRVPPFRLVVHNGAVTLYGTVQGEIEYRQLESIAKFTGGVLRVTNNLRMINKPRQ